MSLYLPEQLGTYVSYWMYATSKLIQGSRVFTGILVQKAWPRLDTAFQEQRDRFRIYGWSLRCPTSRSRQRGDIYSRVYHVTRPIRGNDRILPPLSLLPCRAARAPMDLHEYLQNASVILGSGGSSFL